MYVFFFDLDNVLLNTNELHFLQKLPMHPAPSTNHLSQNINYSMWHKLIRHEYNKHISNDIYLIELLNQIKHPKYVITNASELHCNLSLLSLGLNNIWSGCVNADMITNKRLKPHPEPYIIATQMAEQMDAESINKLHIFFDDLENNLIIPKQLGWITVLIGKKITNNAITNNAITNNAITNNTKHIDYSFYNIYEALNFFIKIT